MVVVLVQSPNGKHFLRAPHLTFHQTVFPTGASLQGQSAVGPQLPLGTETMWGLNQSHRQGRSNRPQVRNLSQLRGDGMLATLRQQFPPSLLAQVLQHVQLLVELFGSTADAG